jgi:hypothetical protein
VFQEAEYFARLREPTDRFLREDQLPVHRHVEDSAVAGDQGRVNVKALL